MSDERLTEQGDVFWRWCRGEAQRGASVFERLDRADDFLFKVGRWIGTRAATVGLSAWVDGPEHEQARVRSARLLGRAANRVKAEQQRLAAAGIPERTSQARLHRHRRERDSRLDAGRAAR